MGAKNQFPQISRQNRLKAIEEGSTTYISGTACKHCNTAEKYVKNSSCVECTTIRTKQRDPSVFKKYIKSEKGQLFLKEFRKSSTHKQTQQRWLERSGYATYIQSFRRKQIKLSQVDISEEDLEQIKKIYEEAARLRKETGCMYHVDHIIRLADGGPHHPSNLQILDEDTHKLKTSQENRKGGQL